MSSLLHISLEEKNSVYGPMYEALSRNYVGSWGDAQIIYTDIRRGLVWEELRALVAAKATKENQAKAQTLLDELKKLEFNPDNYAAATALVKAWVPLPKTKPKAKAKITNSFATLGEDSDSD